MNINQKNTSKPADSAFATMQTLVADKEKLQDELLATTKKSDYNQETYFNGLTPYQVLCLKVEGWISLYERDHLTAIAKRFNIDWSQSSGGTPLYNAIAYYVMATSLEQVNRR